MRLRRGGMGLGGCWGWGGGEWGETGEFVICWWSLKRRAKSVCVSIVFKGVLQTLQPVSDAEFDDGKSRGYKMRGLRWYALFSRFELISLVPYSVHQLCIGFA